MLKVAHNGSAESFRGYTKNGSSHMDGNILQLLRKRRGPVNEIRKTIMFKRIDHVEIVTDQPSPASMR